MPVVGQLLTPAPTTSPSQLLAYATNNSAIFVLGAVLIFWMMIVIFAIWGLTTGLLFLQ
jgi:hypothetical protein